jgi:hypothetical protein
VLRCDWPRRKTAQDGWTLNRRGLVARHMNNECLIILDIVTSSWLGLSWMQVNDGCPSTTRTILKYAIITAHVNATMCGLHQCFTIGTPEGSKLPYDTSPSNPLYTIRPVHNHGSSCGTVGYARYSLLLTRRTASCIFAF